jgi:hypothetical protein
MDKRESLIILFVVLIVLSLLTVFVYKARGSNDRDLVEGCTPYNVSISKEGEYEALIEWFTVDDCLGYVTYGDSRDDLEFIAIDKGDLSSNIHKVYIDKLVPSMSYFFIINSGDSSYGNKGIPLSFSLSSL